MSETCTGLDALATVDKRAMDGQSRHNLVAVPCCSTLRQYLAAVILHGEDRSSSHSLALSSSIKTPDLPSLCLACPRLPAHACLPLFKTPDMRSLCLACPRLPAHACLPLFKTSDMRSLNLTETCLIAASAISRPSFVPSQPQQSPAGGAG